MKKSFVVLGGNFLFLSLARAKKKYLRGQISQKHKRERQAFIYKFISQTSTIIYREEDNRHK
jgi:hypothetical protein